MPGRSLFPHRAYVCVKGRAVTKPIVLIAEELSPATVDALGPDFEIRRCDGADRADLLASLPATLRADELVAAADASGDVDLWRLSMEYLPLTFSRRHGDPSRPWNMFAIKVQNEEGNQILDYQGNWRDIFQNWEALALSFPEYIESFVAKFVFGPSKIEDWDAVWMTVKAAAMTDEATRKDFQSQVGFC